MTILLSSAGKAATSPAYTFVSDDALLQFEGDFSGESAYIQRYTIGDGWQTLEDGTITYATEKFVRLFRGAKIRITTSNGAGTPTITASANNRDN